MAISPPEPEDYARQLLATLKLDRVTDLNQLLNPLRLTVTERRTTSFEGALVCRKNRSKGIIVVSESTKEEGRKRFTVCHEVGHFILPGHGEADCKPRTIESWQTTLSTKETHANRVASELLLPSKLIYPLVGKYKATIDLARQIAEEFNTSLTAAAYKMVVLSDERCALVLSTNGQLRWFKRNANFHSYISGGRLDEQSLASSLNDGSNCRAEGYVYAESWLSGDGLSGRDKIWEDSISLPYYTSVLTVLTL